MNKKLIIILIIVLVLIIGTVLYFVLTKKEKPEEDNYDYQVVLEINAGIPFKWEYKIEDESIIKLAKHKSEAEETKEPISGGLVYEKYSFEGLKEGTTTITFSFTNFVENTVEKTEEYEAIVNKDLEIEIKRK